jgi:hypothetical protein
MEILFPATKLVVMGHYFPTGGEILMKSPKACPRAKPRQLL